MRGGRHCWQRCHVQNGGRSCRLGQVGGERLIQIEITKIIGHRSGIGFVVIRGRHHHLIQNDRSQFNPHLKGDLRYDCATRSNLIDIPCSIHGRPPL